MGLLSSAVLFFEVFIKNLRAANWQPSTNTKTKLDLTKAFKDFHKPWNAVANLQKVSEYSKTFLLFFA